MSSKNVAVITGGASGIGEACAEILKHSGFEIVIADYNEQLGRQVAEKLLATFVHMDVTDDRAVFAASDYVFKEIGPVTALVNSAGVIQKGPSRPADMLIEEWDKIVSVDQRGTYLSCVAFGEKMKARGEGAIVNIASIAGIRSVPLHSYAPAKAAVISMTQTLAAEWGGHMVRVNCVSPGYTLTPALDAAIKRGDRDVKDIISSTALGKLVNVGDIAEAVNFLLSDNASAITGVNLPVDAGWLCASSWGTYGGLRK